MRTESEDRRLAACCRRIAKELTASANSRPHPIASAIRTKDPANCSVGGVGVSSSLHSQACVGVCLRPIARANVCLRLQARGPRRPAKDRQAESRQTKEFRTRRRRNPYRSWKRVTGAQIFACLAETRPWLCGPHRVLCGDATSADAAARLLGERKPLLMSSAGIPDRLPQRAASGLHR